MPGAGRLACLVALGWITTSLARDKFVDLPQSKHQPAGSVPISLSTLDRLEDMVWWPTKGAASRAEYAGTAECAKCHFSKAASQLLTEMARASTRSADPSFLEGQKALSFRQAPYSYQIVRNGDAVLDSVGDEHSSISRPLLFAFGKGIVGHTYIYQVDGNLFESRLSYYSALKGLDLTTGHAHSVPPDLERALGRRLEPQEAQECFGCHTTASTTANHFDPNQSLAGVTCEACHGPGSKHVQAMKTGQIERGKKSILNPEGLDPASSVDFCGACHRTFGDVVQMSVRGVATVRFQPFRLEESRCWSRTNGQLTCVTCHNPHEPLVHDIASYDQICLRCHAQSSSRNPDKGRRALACSVSKLDCASCHMPKIEIPGMHHAFTDHWIRITKSDASYPN
jgi:cytochrome c554/c'-like protein